MLQTTFFGHVRQYHSTGAEIDTKMQEVLGTGQYVLGPTLKRFEAELAQFYEFGAEKGTDAQHLASRLKPDVFCFCTLPNLRTAMVSAGIKSGARLIAFEKPVAVRTKEGFALRKLNVESGVKAVVRHQHRPGEHYRKVKEMVDSGALGRIHIVYGTADGWMMHMASHLSLARRQPQSAFL